MSMLDERHGPNGGMLANDLNIRNRFKKIDPFLIFCQEKRLSVISANPHLSNSDIISVLGSMWRSLEKPEKEHYNEISHIILSIEEGQDSKHGLHKKKGKHIHNTQLKAVENKILYSNIPKIPIVSRNGFWNDLEDLSNSIIKLERSQ